MRDRDMQDGCSTPLRPSRRNLYSGSGGSVSHVRVLDRYAM